MENLAIKVQVRLLLLSLVLSGCGSDSPGPSAPPPATALVDVGNDFFRSAGNGSTDPAVDTVAVNGTVTWTWLEAGEHGVAFDEHPEIPPSDFLFELGSQHSVTFPAVGTFTYTCSIHRTRMSGSVVVR